MNNKHTSNYNTKMTEQTEPKLSMENINTRITQEVCHETLEKLTDVKLLCDYKGINLILNFLDSLFIHRRQRCICKINA